MGSDWVVAIATVMYVFLTALICFANFKSARVTKKQTDELRLQRELTYRPNVEICVDIIRSCFFVFVVRNSGVLSAEGLRIHLNDEFINNTKEETSVRLKEVCSNSIYLAPGQKFYIGISDLEDFPKVCNVKASFAITYNNGKYNENIEIDLSQYGSLLIKELPEDRIAKALEQSNKELKKQTEVLEKEVKESVSRILNYLIVKNCSLDLEDEILRYLTKENYSTTKKITDSLKKDYTEVCESLIKLKKLGIAKTYLDTDLNDIKETNRWFL